MAIVIANLGASANPDINTPADAASYANTSWTPPTDGIIICDVFGSRNAGPDTPTVSGNSLTWVELAQRTFGTSRRLVRFAALAAGATTGATTIDFGGNVQLQGAALFCHVTGVDLSSGLTSAFVQHVSNGAATGTTATATLAAGSHADNRPLACFASVMNEFKTVQTNWTELDDVIGTGPVRGFQTQYRSDAFDVNASATWVTTGPWGVIASELKAEVAGGADDFQAQTIQFGSRLGRARTPTGGATLVMI